MPDVEGAAVGWSRAFLELHNNAPAGTYFWTAGWTVMWNDANNWRLFWEWGLGDQFDRVTTLWILPDPTTELRVTWNNAPGGGQHTFYFFVDSVSWTSKVLPWSPADGRVVGHVYNRANQFPGRVTNKAEMTSTQAHRNGTWTPFVSTSGMVGWSTAVWANFVDVAGDPTRLRMWDGDCS